MIKHTHTLSIFLPVRLADHPYDQFGVLCDYVLPKDEINQHCLESKERENLFANFCVCLRFATCALPLSRECCLITQRRRGTY